MTTYKLLKVEKETEPKCWHCQTNIKYACWIESSEGEIICVGRDCCSNFLSRKETKLAKDKCSILLKVEKTRKKVYSLTEDRAERARLVYLHLGNNDLIAEHFPKEWAHLIK